MAVLEVWGPRRHDVAVLDGSRYNVGKRGDADLPITADAAAGAGTPLGAASIPPG